NLVCLQHELERRRLVRHRGGQGGGVCVRVGCWFCYPGIIRDGFGDLCHMIVDPTGRQFFFRGLVAVDRRGWPGRRCFFFNRLPFFCWCCVVFDHPFIIHGRVRFPG